MTQAVDVGPGVNVEVGQLRLLRAHVLQRAHHGANLRVHRFLADPLARRLGNAEVDDFRLGPAVHCRHQDVARLQVTVDDPFLVRVLHRLADLDEQFEPGPHGQPLPVAVLDDGRPIHQFHHEKRLAGRGGAAVVDAGDVRVVHQGERLPLGVEPGQHPLRVHPGLDQFERDLPLHRLGLVGPVDRPHPALADDLNQGVPSGNDLAMLGW